MAALLFILHVISKQGAAGSMPEPFVVGIILAGVAAVVGIVWVIGYLSERHLN